MPHPISPFLHAVILLATAFIVGRLRPASLESGNARYRTLAAAMLALVPITQGLFSERVATSFFGTEGVVESLTAGLLLAMLVARWRERAWLATLAIAIFLAEELDWGLVLLGNSPSQPSWLKSRSGAMNLHNTRFLDWFWKPVPMLAVMLLGAPRLPAWVEAWRRNRLTLHVVARARGSACNRVHGTQATDKGVVANDGGALAPEREDGGRVRGARRRVGKHTSVVVESARA